MRPECLSALRPRTVHPDPLIRRESLHGLQTHTDCGTGGSFLSTTQVGAGPHEECLHCSQPPVHAGNSSGGGSMQPV